MFWMRTCDTLHAPCVEWVAASVWSGRSALIADSVSGANPSNNPDVALSVEATESPALFYGSKCPARTDV
jgi:hypothetical protein